MAWSTPSFQEIKMDAEARGYAGWVDSPDGPEVPVSVPLASAASDGAGDDGASG